MRHELAKNDWDNASDKKKRFLQYCQSFSMGEPVAILDEDDNITGYFINHPRFNLERRLELEEALEVKDQDIPDLPGEGEIEIDPPNYKKILEDRVRPVNEKGERIRDEIKEKIASFDEDTDIEAEVKKFRKRVRPERGPRVERI